MGVQQPSLLPRRPVISIVPGEVDPLPPVDPPPPTPRLESLALSVSTITGGQALTGTVTLTLPAEADLVCSLSSGDPAAQVPPSVTVLLGETTATFPVATTDVPATTAVEIRASDGQVYVGATLTIDPAPPPDPPPPPPPPDPVLSVLTLAPAVLVGGTFLSVTVTLDRVAPTGGWGIALTATGGVTVPASITVPAGALTLTIQAATPIVTAQTSATITATDPSGVTRVGSVLLDPEPVTPPPVPTLVSLTVTPGQVTAPASAQGLVTLSGAAPAGGLVVALSDNATSVATPGSVTVPAGQTTASFTVTTTDPGTQHTATISATLNGITQTATLVVDPVPPPPPPPPVGVLATFTVSPSTVTGGASAQGVVTLTAAVSTATTVSLSSSASAVTVPASVTVPAGALSTTVPITTAVVSTQAAVTLTASAGGVTRTALLTVQPAAPPPPPPPPGGAAHDYFNALRARADVGVAYSLRDPVQLETYRTYKGTRPAAITYIYPNDPDPRAQDAAKMVIPAHTVSLPSQLRFPLGSHHPQNLLLCYDLWYGAEFAFTNTGINIHKGMLQFASPLGDFWTSLHGAYNLAGRHTQNMPDYATHGPFVVMPYLHGSNGNAQFYDFGTTRGGANAQLPYDAAGTLQRNYGSEALGPRDTSVDASGAEFGVQPEIWTRYWVLFVRDAAHDKMTSGTLPKPMYAYTCTVWIADEERAAVRLVNDLVVYPSPDAPGGWEQVWYEFNSSSSQLALDKIAAGRGPLVGYLRNLVTLVGVSKATVTGLLQSPVR